MELLNTEILEKFRKVWQQSDAEDPIVICKFFNPTGAWTWYATEFDEETGIFFWYVSIFGDWNDEWWCFSLQELKSFKWRFWLGIERDIHFPSQRFSETR